VIFLQTQNIKPSTEIRTYDAEDIFEWLNYHDQGLTYDHLFEIRKQNALEEAEEPEPELTERIMAVSVV
jgi:hypothetical protein